MALLCKKRNGVGENADDWFPPVAEESVAAHGTLETRYKAPSRLFIQVAFLDFRAVNLNVLWRGFNCFQK